MNDEHGRANDHRLDGDENDGDADYLISFAYEESFLAWQCVAVGLLVAGVAVGGNAPEHGAYGLANIAAIVLLGAAAIATGTGLRRWKRSNRRTRDSSTDPLSQCGSGGNDSLGRR